MVSYEQIREVIEILKSKDFVVVPRIIATEVHIHPRGVSASVDLSNSALTVDQVEELFDLVPAEGETQP